MRPASADTLRYLGALATLVVGAVHLQQYADFIADVPTIGVLFVLNALGAGVLAVMLVTRRAAVLGAVGAVALSAAALVSLAISMSAGGLFDYTEPAFRPAVVVSVAAEVAAIVLLAAYLAVRRAPRRARVDWTAA